VTRVGFNYTVAITDHDLPVHCTTFTGLLGYDVDKVRAVYWSIPYKSNSDKTKILASGKFVTATLPRYKEYE